MATYYQMVVVSRVFRGLLAGRDGEEVIAEVRDCAVSDPKPILKKAAVVAVLVIVALGCAEAAIKAKSPLLAHLNTNGTVVDL